MKKRYITWPQLKGYCLEIAVQMIEDDWKPDLIIGITRGGATPAVLLSQFFKCKMIGLDVALRDTNGYGPVSDCASAEEAQNGKKILIVDDINDTGATINWIMKDWDCPKNSIKWDDNVRFAVVVDNESSKANIVPKYSGLTINKAEIDEWIVFPTEEWWMADSEWKLN